MEHATPGHWLYALRRLASPAVILQLLPRSQQSGYALFSLRPNTRQCDDWVVHIDHVESGAYTVPSSAKHDHVPSQTSVAPETDLLVAGKPALSSAQARHPNFKLCNEKNA
jgi:hypothetical protein